MMGARAGGLASRGVGPARSERKGARAMATQIHRTWGEIVGEAKSLHVDLMEVYQNSPIARIDIDCPGGNEAWFFRDEADWLAWEDFDREVSLDEPGVACVDPCEGKPRMC